jgi:hypothetical protein
MVGIPTNPNLAIQIVDAVTAGGLPIGQGFVGMAQEGILPFTWSDGTPGAGSGGWVPNLPSSSFNLNNSAINDQFQLPGIGGPWFGLQPVGTLCTFTQNLQIIWDMPDIGTGKNQLCTATLTTLTWTWRARTLARQGTGGRLPERHGLQARGSVHVAQGAG